MIETANIVVKGTHRGSAQYMAGHMVDALRLTISRLSARPCRQRQGQRSPRASKTVDVVQQDEEPCTMEWENKDKGFDLVL